MPSQENVLQLEISIAVHRLGISDTIKARMLEDRYETVTSGEIPFRLEIQIPESIFSTAKAQLISAKKTWPVFTISLPQIQIPAFRIF